MHIQIDSFLRAKQIHKHRDNPSPLIPVGPTTWWHGVKTGLFPQPIKLTPKLTVWRASDIQRFIEEAESIDDF